MPIISEVNTNHCVDSTNRERTFYDFDIVVPEDCVAGSFPDLHEARLKNVQIYFGALTNPDEVAQKLAGEKACLTSEPGLPNGLNLASSEERKR
jgi:nicotinamidase-related amidase